MKKFLLGLFVLLSVSSAFAQPACISRYKINNGGGKPCAKLGNTQDATGSVTLTFTFNITANNLPQITKAVNITDPNNPIDVTDVQFIVKSYDLDKNEVEYCYYIGPANNNNLQGANDVFRFVISYTVNGQPFICGNEDIGLPVTFKSFKADRKSSSSVGVTWTTASEQNNKGFFVQRNDGSGWKNVAFVFSAANNGNSSSDLSYSFNDVNTETAISQYRVQQVDLDGMARYSTISAVRGLTSTTKLLVYPNPSSNGIVNVVFDQDGTQDVQVSDAAGRSIRQFKAVTNNILVIENLKSGFYTLKITNRNTAKTVTQKVVVK
jgi:hypothetical protein